MEAMATKGVQFLRKRPYLVLLFIVFTPPFWTLLFFLMPVILAGGLLVAGFVVVDQAKQTGGPDENKNSLTSEGGVRSLEEKHLDVAPPSTKDQNAHESSSLPKIDNAAMLTRPVDARESSTTPVESILDQKALPPETSSSSRTVDTRPKPPERPDPEKGPESVKPQPVQMTSAPMTGPAMLARAAALRKSKLEAAAKKSGEILFLYGSQTGNAMEVAKSLKAEAETHGITCKVLALDEKPLHKIPGNTKAAVFVVSSTGDGDPPENCERFHNALKKRTHPPDFLNGLQYTVLGLGDSNYTTYMGVPRVFTSRLPELGAKRFYKTCEADEVDGLEDVIDVWKEGLWAALKAVAAESPDSKLLSPNGVAQNGTAKGVDDSEECKLVGVPPLQQSRIRLVWWSEEEAAMVDSTVSAKENGLAAANGTTEYTAANPFSAPVTRAEYMTATWSDRRVIHVEVDISQSELQYKPGDSLGVLPENSPELVDGLLERLGAIGSRIFSVAGVDDVSTGGAKLLGHVKWPCTLREALLRHCDLTAVARKGLLRVLAEYCSDAKERTELLMLSSRGGKEAYRVQIQEARPSLLEILKRFPSCKPDLAHLLDSLPPLVARMYSVTCSPAVEPKRVQVAFSVVREESTDGRVFDGVCTSWLERKLGLDPKTSRQLSKPVHLPVFLKSGGDFRLPGSLESPLLLIGPGTGVAPFRGFLQQRREQLKDEGAEKAGEAWLFFGCRREDEDFLYKEDLMQFAADGTLTKLVTAFSREGQAKVYVQDKLLQHTQQLASLIRHDKASVFICGDGVNMARDVHAALTKVLVDGSSMPEADATAFLANMTKEKRYVRDIWS